MGKEWRKPIYVTQGKMYENEHMTAFLGIITVLGTLKM